MTIICMKFEPALGFYRVSESFRHEEGEREVKDPLLASICRELLRKCPDVRVGIPAYYGREQGICAIDDKGEVQIVIDIRQRVPWEPTVAANQR